MITDFLTEIVENLKNDQQAESIGADSSLAYISCTLPAIDLFDLLGSAAPEVPRFFWKSSTRPLTHLGFGVAHQITAELEKFGSITSRLSNFLEELEVETNLRFFGGSAFSQCSSSDEWSSFPDCGYFLPRILITQMEHSALLTVVLEADRPEQQCQQIERLVLWFDDNHREQESAEFFSSKEPEMPEWSTMVEKACSKIEAAEVDKVVLCRRESYSAGAHRAHELLRELGKNSQNGDLFLFSIDGSATLLGCTPERLFTLSGSKLSSIMLGGTRPRSTDSEQDFAFEKELLESQKERFEHQCIRDELLEGYSELVTEPVISEQPEILKLSTVQHLSSEISGNLKKGVDLAKVITTLHPTAAVGGVPRQQALELIKEIEGAERGWYAGAFGLFGKDQVECGIAIRSALLSSDRLILFAGCGIVSGSTPEGEWQETECKLQSLSNIWLA